VGDSGKVACSLSFKKDKMPSMARVERRSSPGTGTSTLKSPEKEQASFRN
jgi:hypothetical protein